MSVFVNPNYLSLCSCHLGIVPRAESTSIRSWQYELEEANCFIYTDVTINQVKDSNHLNCMPVPDGDSQWATSKPLS